jgi:hypothetical protein
MKAARFFLLARGATISRFDTLFRSDDGLTAPDLGTIQIIETHNSSRYRGYDLV